jgi:hypothetical protein
MGGGLLGVVPFARTNAGTVRADDAGLVVAALCREMASLPGGVRYIRRSDGWEAAVWYCEV